MVESDERQRSSVVEIATEFLRVCNSVPALNALIVPVTQPLQAILETLRRQRLENIRYLVDTLLEEVEGIRRELDVMSEDHRKFVETEWVRLVLDGFAKAQTVRAKARIKRLAMILSHAYLAGNRRPADLAEELMRVAIALDDDDVRILEWLCEGMGGDYNPKTGIVGFEQANDFWGEVEHKQGGPGGRSEVPSGLNLGDVMTCCAKLQAFGLVLLMRQNPGKTFAVLPYSPMKRGYDLLEYIASSG